MGSLLLFLILAKGPVCVVKHQDSEVTTVRCTTKDGEWAECDRTVVDGVSHFECHDSDFNKWHCTLDRQHVRKCEPKMQVEFP